MTEEEDDSIKEEDSITSLRELEEFVAISLLELDGDPGTESGMTTLEEEVFLTEEEEDEDETYSSLFEEVPLSPPQANKEAQSAMLATTKTQLFKNDNLKSLINTPTTGKIYIFPIKWTFLNTKTLTPTT